jgi:hypothetical protein
MRSPTQAIPDRRPIGRVLTRIVPGGCRRGGSALRQTRQANEQARSARRPPFRANPKPSKRCTLRSARGPKATCGQSGVVGIDRPIVPVLGKNGCIRGTNLTINGKPSVCAEDAGRCIHNAVCIGPTTQTDVYPVVRALQWRAPTACTADSYGAAAEPAGRRRGKS